MSEPKQKPELINSSNMRFRYRWVIFLLGVILLCVAAYSGAVTPRHIEIAIPGPKGYWDYTEHTMRIWESSEKREAIVRKEALLFYAHTGGNEENLAQIIAAYFDSPLREQGWIYHGDWKDACDEYLLPESRFSSDVEDMYLVFYRKRDPQDWVPSPELCVGIWPYNANKTAYVVVLTTKNPSWFTVFDYEFSHPRH